MTESISPSEPSRAATARNDFALVGMRRPTSALMTYYILQSILTGPGVVVLLPLRWFRYRTLRYVFDEEGVTMRWGILFRREISLTYARIQDIHLVSNVVERWLGLGRVQIQTASGHSGAEMTVEGLVDYQAVRDELYRRMRGARVEASTTPAHAGTIASTPPSAPASAEGEIVAALNAAVAELRALRAELGRAEPR